MRQPEFKPRLIHTKRGAVFALCCTGYVATLSVRDVLWHSHRQHHWLLDFDWLVLWHISLPAWIVAEDRKSTRLNSSHSQISYAVFCLKKKKYSTASDLSYVLAHNDAVVFSLISLVF